MTIEKISTIEEKEYKIKKVEEQLGNKDFKAGEGDCTTIGKTPTTNAFGEPNPIKTQSSSARIGPPQHVRGKFGSNTSRPIDETLGFTHFVGGAPKTSFPAISIANESKFSNFSMPPTQNSTSIADTGLPTVSLTTPSEQQLLTFGGASSTTTSLFTTATSRSGFGFSSVAPSSSLTPAKVVAFGEAGTIIGGFDTSCTSLKGSNSASPSSTTTGTINVAKASVGGFGVPVSFAPLTSSSGFGTGIVDCGFKSDFLIPAARTDSAAATSMGGSFTTFAYTSQPSGGSSASIPSFGSQIGNTFGFSIPRK
jgi:hypothetical protein